MIWNIASLTPYAAVSCVQQPLEGEKKRATLESARGVKKRFTLNVDGEKMFAMAGSYAALSDIVDVVRRVLAANASEVYELEF
jgi:hypothetical protein